MYERQLAAGSRWTPNDLVFPSRVGTPLREAHVLKRYHRVLADADIGWHTMHDLRSTNATDLATLGIHPRVAMEMLGHARIETTMRVYTAVVPEAMRDAAKRIDGVMRTRRKSRPSAEPAV